jgi:hypothetical protein
LKVYCKRTFFEKNTYSYSINGKEYGESWVKWEKDKYYLFRIPEDIERSVGIHYYIESERESFWSPIKKKEFNKYFTDIDELRNNKIEQILNGTSEI